MISRLHRLCRPLLFLALGLAMGLLLLSDYDVTTQVKSLNCPGPLAQRHQLGEGLKPSLPELSQDVARLYKYALNPKDTSLLLSIIGFLDKLMSQENITYFLSMGSALGSYRHHGLIPWDDDMDIYVPFNNKRRFRAALLRVMKEQDEYKFKASSSRLYKVYSTSGHVHPFPERTEFIHPTIEKMWRLPFVDVFFYHENDTHIWSYMHVVTPISQVLPVIRRPFSGLLLPCPRDPRGYLQTLGFNQDVCFTGDYDHMLETYKNQSDVAQVPCAALVGRVPFVRHTRGPGGAWCEESLTLGEKQIGTFVRSSEGLDVC